MNKLADYVDPEILPVVQKLNKLRVKTLYSCASFGPHSSHPAPHIHSLMPYIMFFENKKWINFIKNRKTTITVSGKKFPFVYIEKNEYYKELYLRPRYEMTWSKKLSTYYYKSRLYDCEQKSIALKNKWIKTVTKLVEEYENT